MINWDVFKNNLKTYFASKTASDTSQVADYIATQYDIAIKSGADVLYGNKMVAGNKDGLASMIKASFNIGMSVKSGTYNSLDMIANGLTIYWVGTSLLPINPPPGSIGIVQNLVLNPGKAAGIITPPTENEDNWIDMFVIMARNHLLSISGTTIALVSTPTGPVPTPFPWQGYN